MGYYTQYELEVDGEICDYDPFVDHEKDIGAISGFCNPFEEECKWYDREDHMRKYSKKYPEKLFKISGKGEISGDIWVEYYKDGLMQRCEAKIEFAPSEENLLL